MNILGGVGDYAAKLATITFISSDLCTSTHGRSRA